MSEKATMQVNIVCAEHPVWSGEALQVTIPASGGQMGILPNHEPVLTLIKQGKLAVVEKDGSRFEQAHRCGRRCRYVEACRGRKRRITALAIRRRSDDQR